MVCFFIIKQMIFVSQIWRWVFNLSLLKFTTISLSQSLSRSLYASISLSFICSTRKWISHRYVRFWPKHSQLTNMWLFKISFQYIFPHHRLVFKLILKVTKFSHFVQLALFRQKSTTPDKPWNKGGQCEWRPTRTEMSNFASKLGQIGLKWNKSGTFEDQFQYILARV